MVPRELGFDLACDPGAARAFPVVRAGEGIARESACATSVFSGAPTGVVSESVLLDDVSTAFAVPTSS